MVYAIYLNLGVYVTKCNIRLGFFWKFDVVLGLCGLKKLRRERRPMGSRERDLKPFLVGDGKNLGGHMTHPQLLMGFKCESQTENNGRTRSQSTFPSLQHYRRVEGRAGAPGWD